MRPSPSLERRGDVPRRRGTGRPGRSRRRAGGDSRANGRWPERRSWGRERATRERSLGHVDEHAHAVGDILVECAFEAKLDGTDDGGDSRRSGPPSPGTVAHPQARTPPAPEPSPACSRRLGELRSTTHHGRSTSPHPERGSRWCRSAWRAGHMQSLGILQIQEGRMCRRRARSAPRPETIDRCDARTARERPH